MPRIITKAVFSPLTLCISAVVSAAKTMVKRKKLFTALLALSWTFSVTAAERIVVAGGSLTELIYAMGAGKRVVGVDETTSYPPETAKLPHIGYWKQLSSEGILSLRPDSVITAGCRTANCARPTAGAKSQRRHSAACTSHP